MKDERKTKAQLIGELQAMRLRVEELEAEIAGDVRAEKAQAALFQLSADLAAIIDEKDACRQAIHGLRNIMGYDNVGLFLVDETTGERVLQASVGWVNAPSEWRIPPGQGLTEFPLLEGKLHYVPDVTRDSRHLPGISEGRSELDLPVWVGGKVLGALSVESKEIDAFDENDFAVLTAAANQIGVAIERSRVVQALKEAEEKFRQSEALYRNLIETSPDSITVVDLEGDFIMANQQAARLYGCETVDEFLALGKNAFDLIAPEDRQLAVENAQKVLETGDVLEVEYTTLRQDGSVFPAELRASLITDADGNPQAFVGVTRDITERRQVERELRESRALFRSLVESMPQNVFSKDLEGRFTFANQRYCTTERKSLEDILGKNDYDLHPPDLAEKYRADDRRVIETEQILDTVEEHQPVDGETSLVQVVKAPIYDAEDEIIGIVGVFWDVTEHKRMEREIIYERDLLQALMDNIPDSIYFKDTECRLTRINRKMMRDVGLDDVSEAVGKTDKELFGEEFGRMTEAYDRRVMETGEPIINLIESRQLENGQLQWTSTTKVPLRDVDGQVVGLVGSTREITGLIRAEEALRESERFLRDIFDAIQDGISVLDADLNIIRVNPWIEKMYASQLPLTGKKCYEAYQQRESPCPWCPSLPTLETGEPHTEIVPHPRDPEEPPGWMELTAFPLKDDDGHVTGIIEYVKDITERKQAEEALRESEEKYRRLFELESDAIFLIDKETGDILEVNAFASTLYGYSREELLHMKNSDLSAQPDETRRATTEEASRIPTRLHRKKDGTVFLVDITATHFDWRGRRVHIAAIRDVTERARIEEALRKSEEKHRTILENIEDGYYEVDLAGALTFFNDAMCQMIGYSPSEMMGINYRQYMEKDTAQKVSEVFNRVYTSGKPDRGFGWELLARDGTKKIVEASVSLIRDSAGEPIGFRGIARDITRRVQAEETLRRHERLAAVGQLAAGVAHDFNNLLTSIIGYAELLHVDPDLSQQARADVGRVVEQGQRAAHLVRQILDFSRKSIRQPQLLNLAPFLKESISLLERTIPENIHIQLGVEPSGERLALADPTQLQQLVTNLAINARDAMPQGGELMVNLSYLTLESGEEPPCADLPAGEWAVLVVADTGEGIPEDMLPRIYEPFFTTKAPEGSGLGLAQVYGIVKQHEGYIDVKSEVGKGTAFSIYLPVLAVGGRTIKEESLQNMPLGHGELVLLVEDEPAVLEASKAMLNHLGYRVVSAVDGRQALEIYAEYEDEIALVLADIVMPNMDGVALFRALKSKYPHVVVILTTGYPLEEEAQWILAQGVADWMRKPLTLSQLARTIHRALRYARS